MMNVSEIKIDNFIQLYRKAEDAEKTVFQIKSIYFEDELSEYFVELNDRFIVNVKTGISPIEITPEWLLKFGFIEDEKCKSLYKFNGVGVWYYPSRPSVMLHKCEPNNFNYRYVHQLQNIYNALTGENLKLKT